MKIYCGAPIIEASHSDFEDPIKRQINLARYREILEDWIEFDNQAIAWKISKLPVVPHVNSYQINKPPSKTAWLIFYGAEPQLARVLQSARAMASITRLCAADVPATGKFSGVTPDILKEVRSADEAIDQILALLQPKFPSPSKADPFFEIYASLKIANFRGLRVFGALAAPRNRELLQGPTPRAG